jgi:hypothetical protein
MKMSDELLDVLEDGVEGSLRFFLLHPRLYELATASRLDVD